MRVVHPLSTISMHKKIFAIWDAVKGSLHRLLFVSGSGVFKIEIKRLSSQCSMCSCCKGLSFSFCLRFSLVIRDRARTVTLTQPLSPQCFRTEWGALGASAVYCDCREERKIQPVCIKTYSASFLFASNTEHPECSSEVSALSLPRSRPLHPLTLAPILPSQPLPLLLNSASNLSFVLHSESQMTARKHPLPSHSTRAFSPLPPAPVALGSDAHHIDRWSQPWPLSSPVGTPAESTPDSRRGGWVRVRVLGQEGEYCFVTTATHIALSPADSPSGQPNALGWKRKAAGNSQQDQTDFCLPLKVKLLWLFVGDIFFYVCVVRRKLLKV